MAKQNQGQRRDVHIQTAKEWAVNLRAAIESPMMDLRSVITEIELWGQFCKKQGLDINQIEMDSGEPLLAQSIVRHVKKLISKEPFSANVVDEKLQGPLTPKKAETLLKAVWDQGVLVDHMTRGKVVFQVSVLHLASFYGLLDIVKLCIERGADPEFENFMGASALLNAADAGQIEVVTYLLEQGANLNHCDKNKANALHAAIEEGHDDLAIFLIQRGAELNLKDSVGDSPLHAAVYGDALPVLKALVEAGADLTIVNRRLKTPLMEAMEADYNSVELAQYLQGAENAKRERAELEVALPSNDSNEIKVDLSASEPDQKKNPSDEDGSDDRLLEKDPDRSKGTSTRPLTQKAATKKRL